MNIDRIVNANGLMKRCMEATGGGSMVGAYRARRAFDGYVGEGANRRDCAVELTRFLHRGNPIFYGNTYKEKKFCTKEVFYNVVEGNSETGNCLVLSQVGAYLLLCKDIEVNVLSGLGHVLLEVNIDGEKIPIETTIKNGFGVLDGESKGMDIGILEAMAYCNRGNAWYKKGDYDKAIENYDKAINVNPDFENAYYNKGAAWHKKGDYDKAIENYDKAINVNPDFENAYYNRGNAWFNKGDYNKAIENYDKAIKINPDYENAYYNKGFVWHKKGDYDKALVDFKKYASFGEENARKVEGAIGWLREIGEET